MNTESSRFRWFTKEELIDRCSEENVIFFINGELSNDVKLVKQILLNEEGMYTYSISIDGINAEGMQVAEIKYEISNRHNRDVQI